MSTSRNWSEPTPYPDPAVETIDRRFAKYRIGNAAVERLFTGCRWAEGPVWFGDARQLLWSDIPNNRILRYEEDTGTVTVFRKPSNYANGNTRDREGRLVTCEHATRRVTRTEYDGSITVLADHYEGKKLGAPNDVVVHSDGAVWFTDPGYGAMLNYEGFVVELELPNRVYRLDPITSELTIVADDFVKPNGLAFSPDESLLYIADTGASHDPDGPAVIRVFDVAQGRRLTNGRLFKDMAPGFADGFRVDVDGNIWTSASWGGEEYDNGVHVFAPDGDLIGKILLPEACANLCFGGEKKNRLYMCGSQSLYALYVEAVGCMWP